MTRQKLPTFAIDVLTVLAAAGASVPGVLAMAAAASIATAPAAVASAQNVAQPAGTLAGKQDVAKGAAMTPAGTPAEIEGAAVGSWSANLPAASGPGRVVTLTLSAPDRAELSSDYHNGKSPIVKTGTWQAKPGGAITVTLPGAPARPEAKAEVLRFQLQGGALSALAYDTDAWGKEGLRLVKKGGAGVPADGAGASAGRAEGAAGASADGAQGPAGGAAGGSPAGATPGSGGAAGGSARSGPKLKSTLWRLVELRGADGAVVKPDDPEKYTLELESDGRVGVRADCNRGMGRYALEGSALTFTVLAYTKAMCPPGSLYDPYTQALEKAASFAIKDGVLTLALAADAGAMTFEPAK